MNHARVLCIHASAEGQSASFIHGEHGKSGSPAETTWLLWSVEAPGRDHQWLRRALLSAVLLRGSPPGRPCPRSTIPSLIPIHPVHPAAAGCGVLAPGSQVPVREGGGRPCPLGTHSLKGPGLPWRAEPVASGWCSHRGWAGRVHGGTSTLRSLCPRPGPDPRAGAEPEAQSRSPSRGSQAGDSGDGRQVPGRCPRCWPCAQGSGC